MSTNALRSRLNAIARRNSGLSKGGAFRFTIRFVLTLPGFDSQIASGIWLLISRISGIVTAPAKVNWYLPAIKAKIAVERFRVINGLEPNDRLHPGDKVKIVTE